MSTEIPGPEGRTLRVYDAGDPAGPAIVVHHGTPAGGEHFAPWVKDAEARGARLVGYERPGYGASTPRDGRRVADAAADVAAIADALGIERFATWGISGGGPHALACAALLPERVVAAASLAGVAPFDAAGLNFFAGMGRDNIVEFGAVMQGREAIEPMARAMAEEMLPATPEGLVGLMRTLVSAPDEAVLGDELGAYWSAGMPEVFRQGAVGWVDDDITFVEPWGFDPADISLPTLVWHGRHDLFVPVAHGEWLARTIPGAEARITIDDGHLTLIANRVPAVHEWLLARF